jgi:urease accessory protein
MKRFIVLTAVLAGSTASARAHSPVPGIGDFYSGMLHPFLVPAQLLALVALGLMVGQYAPRSARYALPAFVLVLLAALFFPLPVLPELNLPYIALACGIFAVLALDSGAIGPAVFAALTAMVIGGNVRADFAFFEPSWLAFSGTALSIVLILILCSGLAAVLRKPWKGIAVRVLGSWISAVSLMLIALSYVQQQGVG